MLKHDNSDKKSFSRLPLLRNFTDDSTYSNNLRMSRKVNCMNLANYNDKIEMFQVLKVTEDI